MRRNLRVLSNRPFAIAPAVVVMALWIAVPGGLGLLSPALADRHTRLP